MKAICVYCGSSPGDSPVFIAQARRLGTVLAERRVALVYGGGSVGLMGQLADAALAAGGEVLGIIPRFWVGKVSHARLTRLHVVETMHERKAMMFELADGFVALPGGAGTLEEFLEMLTWGQIGLHVKPCGLLNVLGYYDPLVKLLEHAAEHRFMRPEHLKMVLLDDTPEGLLEQFARYQAPRIEKWLDRGREVDPRKVF